ncbi:hypothetical protein SUGI_1192670 [Cryptomeria japonica]|uniref:uncharacterized protein LOC131063107 n=1 Tax=Cryptomeria japonica TaxID=3369 RepID=UPI0024147BCD|nr:uncharacterized protein LOC131063107 [Cryptomeria japonica]GLJ55530.1 hypothetical protein SUGI_1192670 [Cryptomeria japonica]
MHCTERTTDMFKLSECEQTGLKKQARKAPGLLEYNQASQGNSHQKYYGISSPANQEKIFCQGKETHMCNAIKASECTIREDDYNICKTSPRTLIRSLQQQSSSDDSEMEESCGHDKYEKGKWSIRDNPIACADSPDIYDDRPVRKASSWTVLKGRVLFNSPENATQQEEEEEKEENEGEENDFLDNSSLWSSTVERSDWGSSASSNIIQPGSMDTMHLEHLLDNMLQVVSNNELNYGRDIIKPGDVDPSTSLEVVKCRAWNFIELFFRKPLWVKLFLPLFLVAIKLICVHDDSHVVVPT